MPAVGCRFRFAKTQGSPDACSWKPSIFPSAACLQKLSPGRFSFARRATAKDLHKISGDDLLLAGTRRAARAVRGPKSTGGASADRE